MTLKCGAGPVRMGTGEPEQPHPLTDLSPIGAAVCEQPSSFSRQPQIAGTRLLTALCVVYLALLFYASLMPFKFTTNPDWIDAQLSRAWQYWPFRTAVHTSRADMLSNLMLYVPLGLLLAARVALGQRRPRWIALLVGAGVSGAASFLIEFGQLFSMSRVASGTDFLMNLSGGVVGAVAGAVFGGRGWLQLMDSIRKRHAERPLTLVAALLFLVLAADAVYPFVPTLDVSSVKRNLRNAAIWPLPRLSVEAWCHWFANLLRTGFSRHAWHHWLVQRVGVYAVLTVLLGASSTDRSRHRWTRAAAVAFCFAAAAEAAKPFIVSRSANAANVVASAGGALLGLALGMLFQRRLSSRFNGLLPVILILAYIVYLELTPFAFGWDPAAIREKMPKGAKWLPLYHYAMGGRAEDVRLFLRTIILVGALTYAAARHSRRLVQESRFGRILKAALLAGCLGLVLEFGQFFLDRVPSTTDVFCFAVGGALGHWLYGRYVPHTRTNGEKEM